ncbi:isochorismate synthase [Azospirillum agricola]|uniref:isochorismate synthase n=1 Tax=Azospirillum agricola TaxID=1720247 RepID=UPI001AE6038A|nr:isochorismate synthase [Azospirillum agricola]MBP2231643.1 isochorismate synthase [Azospirillum agricola]
MTHPLPVAPPPDRDPAAPLVEPGGLADAVVFLSPSNRMVGHGIAHAADPGGDSDGDPDKGAGDPARRLARLFEAARRDGRAPVVMGAIPFDVSGPSRLIVPRDLDRLSPAGWQAALRRLPGTATTPATPPRPPRAHPLPDPDGYRRAVAGGLARIAEGRLAKLVLARSLDLEADEPIDPGRVLAALIRRHPASFLYSVPLPPETGRDAGVFLGASPELLVRRVGGRVHATPLAGTIAASPDPAENARRVERLLASEKDRHEHAFAARAVAETLRPFCRTIEVPATPGVVAAGPVIHLSTPIVGELRAPHAGALELALALHPTPAVGGTPTDAAVAAIAELEGVGRGLYAGMVGWCDAGGDGEWAVSLRCAEIRGRRARLFAGAGIVHGSDPEAELEETAAKLKTMLAALGF